MQCLTLVPLVSRLAKNWYSYWTTYYVIQVILEVNERAVNQRDEKGRIALHYACAEGSTNCVRTLLTARR